MPGALFKLLMKVKLPYSREVPMNAKEWQQKHPRREKEDCSERGPTSTKSILYHIETVNYHSILCKLFCYNMQVWITGV